MTWRVIAVVFAGLAGCASNKCRCPPAPTPPTPSSSAVVDILPSCPTDPTRSVIVTRLLGQHGAFQIPAPFGEAIKAGSPVMGFYSYRVTNEQRYPIGEKFSIPRKENDALRAVACIENGTIVVHTQWPEALFELPPDHVEVPFAWQPRPTTMVVLAFRGESPSKSAAASDGTP